MAAPQPPPRPAADGHTPGRRRRLPHIRRRGGRIARGLHHGLRPLRPGGVPREQHRLPARRSTRPTCGGRSTSCAASRGRTCSLRSPRADDGRTERRQRILVHVRDRIIPCTATASPGATPGTRRSRPAPTRASSTRSTARSKRSRRSCRPRTSSVPTASSSSRGAP